MATQMAPVFTRSTLEEERLEAMEGALEGLLADNPDPDRYAAGRMLLRHLTGAAPNEPLQWLDDSRRADRGTRPISGVPGWSVN